MNSADTATTKVVTRITAAPACRRWRNRAKGRPKLGQRSVSAGRYGKGMPVESSPGYDVVLFAPAGKMLAGASGRATAVSFGTALSDFMLSSAPPIMIAAAALKKMKTRDGLLKCEGLFTAVRSTKGASISHFRLLASSDLVTVSERVHFFCWLHEHLSRLTMRECEPAHILLKLFVEESVRRNNSAALTYFNSNRPLIGMRMHGRHHLLPMSSNRHGRPNRPPTSEMGP
jgi:hypothetical protein